MAGAIHVEGLIIENIDDEGLFIGVCGKAQQYKKLAVMNTDLADRSVVACAVLYIRNGGDELGSVRMQPAVNLPDSE
jgi:hypothetical protein